jgi:hypothetical protein
MSENLKDLLISFGCAGVTLLLLKNKIYEKKLKKL